MCNTDSNGHLFGAICGAIIGGLIGGIGGAISAAVKGKSVRAGFVTGAVTGAVIGGVCGGIADAVTSGGLSILVGAAISSVVSGVVAAGGNAINQYWNYSIEKKAQTKINNQQQASVSTNYNIGVPKNNSINSTVTNPSNTKLASECDSFSDYVDMDSIISSGISAAIFAQIGFGANIVVNSAFAGIGANGVNMTAQVIANFALGGNVSMIQGIIDLFK